MRDFGSSLSERDPSESVSVESSLFIREEVWRELSGQERAILRKEEQLLLELRRWGSCPLFVVEFL